MSFWDSVRIAGRALSKNRFPASLTILGIVIGIAAVTVMVSIGESASGLVEGQLESLGTNMIAVLPVTIQRTGIRVVDTASLTVEDVKAISEECPSVTAATPLVGYTGYVVYRSNNWSPNAMFGVGVDYPVVRSWNMAKGTFFTNRDINGATKNCVIGQTVVRELFQFEDPLDKTIRIKNILFRVIGVLEPKGVSIVGQDYDDVVLTPYTTAAKRLRRLRTGDSVDAILVSSANAELATQAGAEVDRLLRDRHHLSPGQDPDFRVQNTTEIAMMLKVIMGAITLMLTAIAAISLIVGGVGIMNIMLVSVAERTREIGIRMAIGARGKDILRQFLIEAVLLSCFGGLVGVCLGMGASVLLTEAINWYAKAGHWPVVISVEAAIIAMVFAAVIGVFFGYYPAFRASRLDPIEALRYE